MTAQDSIRLIDVTTGYNRTPVTEHIDASLRAGELTCLLGPNGAGKSTLLKTLCGFIRPLSGEIVYDGNNLRNLSPRMLAQTVGVVLTERPSAMNMSVAELVAMGRSPYTSFFGGLGNADKEIVDAAIDLVGIDYLRNRNISTLSDGERQKALIAKALAQQTPVIFLDEPTAFLDFPSKVEIMKLLYTIAKAENKTIFLSTHDLELAIQLSDRLWILDKGRGLSIGTPAELAADGSIAAYFNRPGLDFDAQSMRFTIQMPEQ